jgi:hypothetical protein
MNTIRNYHECKGDRNLLSLKHLNGINPYRDRIKQAQDEKPDRNRGLTSYNRME